jgi:hypothetical protein
VGIDYTNLYTSLPDSCNKLYKVLINSSYLSEKTPASKTKERRVFENLCGIGRIRGEIPVFPPYHAYSLRAIIRWKDGMVLFVVNLIHSGGSKWLKKAQK